MTQLQRLTRPLKRRRWAVVAAALSVLSAGVAGPATGSVTSASVGQHDGAVVRTDKGLVRGVVTETARTFKGIPYALPPLHQLRWKAPQPVRPWSGVRAAIESAVPCAQDQNSEVPVEGGISNEDCLYLDVTTPRAGSDQPRPVIVWQPGGGFHVGAGRSYGAVEMASRGDVVVVSINYRLGIFGFFGHEGLAGSGTFGLQDQQAALRWVQRNARAFGGDPHDVTLAGQSAGAMSACAQLTSPSAAGLFSKVIMQSGSCDFNWPDNSQYPGQGAGSPWVPQSQVRELGDETAAGEPFGCPGGAAGLACMRNKPPEVLLPSTLSFTSPAFGSAILPENPASALRAGHFHRGPVLSGNNHDEARPWLAAFGAIGDGDYHRLVVDMVGSKQAVKVEREYPRARYESAAIAWATVTTDRIWSCNQVASDKQLARRVPTFSYEFSDQHSPLSTPGQGASHASELPYLFKIGTGKLPLTPDQQQLSGQMIDYWTAFARSANPNGPGRPYWSPLQDSVSGLSLAPTGQGGIRKVDLGVEHHCGFWAGLQSSVR